MLSLEIYCHVYGVIIENVWNGNHIYWKLKTHNYD
jgi:hypothetical protein